MRALAVSWSLLVAAGLWDAVVLWRFGMDSGKTASWLIFSDSEKYPVVALIFGVLTCWVVMDTQTHLGVAVWCFVAGHIFASMHGITRLLRIERGNQ